MSRKPYALLALVLTLILAATGGWLVARQSSPSDPAGSSGPPLQSVSVRDLELPAAKLAAAGIQAELVTRRTLRLTRSLPARFRYDDTRHVAVRAATDGVLESVLAKPGDRVEAGQAIAVLRSPSMAAARSEVLSCESELDLARAERDWRDLICQATEAICESIRRRQPIELVEQAFDEATLGEYRSRLLTSYSKAVLASQLASPADGAAGRGVLSGRVVQQRQSGRQQAESDLQAAIEQSRFETRQTCNQAQAAFERAERRLLVARQALATLLGTSIDDESMREVSREGEDLARLEIRSPLTGTVERKFYSARERILADSELFIIADTSRLWVEADVRERDWEALMVGAGDRVAVTTPADPSARLMATVYFLGREVDPVSGATPLVAQVENADGNFRPGLFARMEVQVGELPDVIGVPESAIVDLAGEASVFVVQGRSFRPTPIELGQQAGDWVEVRSGLQEGARVVVRGAFLLKSELLLEGEE